MKALVIGATGATGRDLLNILLSDESVLQVDIFVRRAPNVTHTKLKVHVIDFDALQQWRHLVKGDVLFSCLGTTIKAAGSQAAQWKIDYDYQYAFAQAASANAVPCYVLVSSGYANAQSRMFYTRMKGQLEEAVQALPFVSTLIFRPPTLVRANSNRAGEVWGVRIISALNRIGLLQSMRPMPTQQLAQALLYAAKQSQSGAWSAGCRVFESTDIWRQIEQQ